MDNYIIVVVDFYIWSFLFGIFISSISVLISPLFELKQNNVMCCHKGPPEGAKSLTEPI